MSSWNVWRLSLAILVVLVTVATTLVSAGYEADYYDVLGLGDQREDAAEREIKSAFRKLSKEYHPDLCGESCREKYQGIQRAYEVLGDRKKRKVYDIGGEEALKNFEKPNQQQNQFDPFAMFFGGGQQQNTAGKGKNIEMVLLVTLEDIYNGAAHNVKLTKQRLCKQCRGTGAASKADVITCNKCKGSGVEIQTVQMFPGFHTQQQVQCSKCGGKGKMVGKVCPTCRGGKVSKSSTSLGIDIERGTPDGFDLIYDMEADQFPDKIPGDVVLTVQTAPHAQFTRDRNDLAMTKQISLKDALLGFEWSMKHLDGHDVEVEESGVIQHGKVSRIKSEGMPLHNVPSETGDLLVTYQIVLPKRLTQAQREIINRVF